MANEYTGQVPLLRPSFQSFMIRERVDVRGYLRQLEPEPIFLRSSCVLTRSDVSKRVLLRAIWTGKRSGRNDTPRQHAKVEKHRARNEKLATKMLEEAAAQGLMDRAALRKLHGQLVRKASSGATDPVQCRHRLRLRAGWD